MDRAIPRWQYRFENYRRAYGLLRDAIELSKERSLTDLEREGVIQRFEITWELSWKLMKDLLSADGVVLETVTPRSVLRAAYQAQIIREGEIWMKALDARNRMSHTYDASTAERDVAEIAREYLRLFGSLHDAVLSRASERRDEE